MNQALQTLKERGFFQQCTDVGGLSALMDKGSVAFYVGVDPTASSLHIGHMVPFFALRHLHQAGHTGIALIGGGTARIGDPSGKTEMRKMLTYDQIDENVRAIEKQLDTFIGFDGKSALSDNNKNWLADLNYIDFLRDIGSCFSVNRMLTFESYKKRMETGLTFIEFNYQLLQSFDYLQLHQRHNCCLQIGGDDQWGNIVAGIDLIRRKTGNQVYGLTFPLITRSDGKKMGKSEKGALFLDPSLTTEYDFFQYWRNVDDADVLKFLLLFTFLSVAECKQIALEGDINLAKERLAYEVTAVIHGKQAADKALQGAKAAFGKGGDMSAMPTHEVKKAQLEENQKLAIDLAFEVGLGATKSDVRRLIQQNGLTIISKNAEIPISDVKQIIAIEDFTDNELVLRAGKKKFSRILLT
ncbi:MAG: tyrosine--tRNA ligase [Treponemataceae bacterium]